jgi:hypothetical protein
LANLAPITLATNLGGHNAEVGYSKFQRPKKNRLCFISIRASAACGTTAGSRTLLGS